MDRLEKVVWTIWDRLELDVNHIGQIGKSGTTCLENDPFHPQEDPPQSQPPQVQFGAPLRDWHFSSSFALSIDIGIGILTMAFIEIMRTWKIFVCIVVARSIVHQYSTRLRTSVCSSALHTVPKYQEPAFTLQNSASNLPSTHDHPTCTFAAVPPYHSRMSGCNRRSSTCC